MMMVYQHLPDPQLGCIYFAYNASRIGILYNDSVHVQMVNTINRNLTPPNVDNEIFGSNKL